MSRLFTSLGGDAYLWPHGSSGVKPLVSLSTRVAMFDLDDTLVTHKHRENKDGPEFLPGVLEALRCLIKDETPIVIMTNQGGLAFGSKTVWPRLEGVIQALTKELGLTKENRLMHCFVAGGRNTYRKPMTGLFEAKIWPMFPAAMNWIYVGDAAGREGDFSSTDRKFAYNVDLLFQYWATYKSRFDMSLTALDSAGITWNADTITKGKRARVTFYTPEEYFPRHAKPFIAIPTEILNKPREWWGFWPAEYLRKHAAVSETEVILEKIVQLGQRSPLVILTIGPPGSGKTTFARALAPKIKLRVIHRDDYKVVGACLTEARKALDEGRHILIDATHPSKTSRMVYQSHLRAVYPDCMFVYVEMTTPRHMAYHMNIVRAFSNMKMGVGEYVPEVAYNQYDKAYQAPDEDEISSDQYFRLRPSLYFSHPEERFRFLQFTEEGAVSRISTMED